MCVRRGYEGYVATIKQIRGGIAYVSQVDKEEQEIRYERWLGNNGG